MDPREMMKGMMGEGFNPMEMCRGMVDSITKSAEMAAYATPEAVAERFKLSKESAVFLISRLARSGKIRISVEQGG